MADESNLYSPPSAAALPPPITSYSGDFAPRILRLHAWLIDILAIAGIIYAGVVVYFNYFFEYGRTIDDDYDYAGSSGLPANVVVLIIIAASLLVYYLLPLLTPGQTLGKRFFGIRVVRYPGGEPANFAKTFVLCCLLPVVVLIVGLWCWFLPAPAVTAIAFGLLLLDVAFSFGKDRRCLHDFAAGTKVVWVNRVPVRTQVLQARRARISPADRPAD